MTLDDLIITLKLYPCASAPSRPAGNRCGRTALLTSKGAGRLLRSFRLWSCDVRFAEQSERVPRGQNAENARRQLYTIFPIDEIIMKTVADMSATNREWEDHQYLTASNLTSFYHFGCQLELWKSFHEGHVRRRQEPPSSISRAHISRGHQWEKYLVERLDAQNLILRISRRESFQAQVEADQRYHFYVINSEFKDRSIFANEYLSRGTGLVPFGTFKPDFIEIWKRVDEGKPVVEYHVIDAKASYSLHVQCHCYCSKGRLDIRRRCTFTGAPCRKCFLPTSIFPQKRPPYGC